MRHASRRVTATPRGHPSRCRRCRCPRRCLPAGTTLPTLAAASEQPVGAAARPTQLGRIVIPAIGLDQPIFEGVDQAAFAHGAGHWPGSAGSGRLGQRRLRWSPHHADAPVPEHRPAQAGRPDRLRDARTAGPTSTASRSVFVVPQTALWITDQKPGRTVTLFTCNPKGSATQRLVTNGTLLKIVAADLSEPSPGARRDAERRAERGNLGHRRPRTRAGTRRAPGRVSQENHRTRRVAPPNPAMIQRGPAPASRGRCRRRSGARSGRGSSGRSAFVLVVASIVASFVQLPYYTIAPGDALNVNSLVTVHGARQYPPKGCGDAAVRPGAVADQRVALAPGVARLRDRSREAAGTFAGNADPAEVDAQAVADMANSQNAAKYVALTPSRLHGHASRQTRRARGHRRRAGRRRAAARRRHRHARREGDDDARRSSHAVIEGRASRCPRHDRLSPRRACVTPRRSSRQRREGPRGHRRLPRRAVASFPVDVRIDTSDIGGPSAGLAMTLSILDELTPGNLTGGKLVAVTGEIAPDGTRARGRRRRAEGRRRAAPRRAALHRAHGRGRRGAHARRFDAASWACARSTDALKALRAAGGDPLPPVQAARTAA